MTARCKLGAKEKGGMNSRFTPQRNSGVSGLMQGTPATACRYNMMTI